MSKHHSRVTLINIIFLYKTREVDEGTVGILSYSEKKTKNKMSAFPAITSNERFDVLLLLSLGGSVQPTVWMVSALIVSRPGSHLISQQIFYFF